MANPVVHWEIAVKDAAQINDFYGRLFGWEIGTEPGIENYWLVQPGGDGGIGGGFMVAKDEMPPMVSVYVMVDDLQAYLDAAERLGGRTLLPPTPIPSHGSCAMFQDPSGNCIGLYTTGG